jgi:hypothetical protein
MTGTLRRFKTICLTTSLSLALPAMPASADMPDNVTDLVYQSTEWGNDQLRMRGYTFINSDYHNGKLFEYWWQGRSSTCIQTRAVDGKYEAIKATANTDCNQYQNSAADKDNTAAAVAIGAAAIIGAAALAHNSHHRDDKHGQDSRSVAEFDRGYRDGLYSQPYHNYSNTPAYSDGYNAGSTDRYERTSYRPQHGRYSGYHPYVSLDDLVGASAASADGELRSRGFRDAGGYKHGGKSFVTWYNRSTRQCVQAVTRDGRIRRFDTIDEGNCL